MRSGGAARISSVTLEGSAIGKAQDVTFGRAVVAAQAALQAAAVLGDQRQDVPLVGEKVGDARQRHLQQPTSVRAVVEPVALIASLRSCWSVG